MTTPKWAQELTLNAILYIQSTSNLKPELPDIRWRKAHGRKCSSGVCYKSHITLVAGSDRTDCKLVLLHEIAHWVNIGEHHSPKFWDIAWQLFREFKLPLRYCKVRESSYRKGSLIAYHRSLNKNKQE